MWNAVNSLQKLSAHDTMKYCFPTMNEIYQNTKTHIVDAKYI